MDAIGRAVAVYFFLVIVIRLAGKRTFAEVTTFDFVLLLIISEASQQALLGNDFSITKGVLVITTLVAVDILMSHLSVRSRTVHYILDDVPLVLLEDGRPLKGRMEKCRVSEADILHAARELQGLESLDQIKYAVLERSGGISIVPKSK